ncbi:MAG: threonine ammonia-lyase, partial [Filomicrobium sp.]
AKAEANVVEVYHQRVFTDLPAKGAELHVVIETRDRAHLERVLDALNKSGYDVAAKGAPE